MAETVDINEYRLDTEFRSYQTRHHLSQRHWWRPGDASTEIWAQIKGVGGTLSSTWLEETITTKQLRVVKKQPMVYDQKWVFGYNWKHELLALINMREYEHLFVRFLGWFKDSSFIYYTLEYLKLGDLEGYMEKFGPLGSYMVKDITAHLLRGLVVLHKNNITHGNLNPTNILISSLSPFCVKISGFGYTIRGLEGRARPLSLFKDTIPYYTAPEVLELLPDQSTDSGGMGQWLKYPRAIDMWALGCLVHKMFTQKLPFTDSLALGIFCVGRIPFQARALEKYRVSERGIDFVRSLLVPDPGSRILAVDALKSSWLGVYNISRYELETEFDSYRKSVVHKSNERALKASYSWFGTWREEKLIGSGGYGTIFLQSEIKTKEQRVVKEIPRAKHDNTAVLRELKALMGVRQCPDSFVRFFGWYEDNKSTFLAMEYIKQGDLGEYLYTNGRQTEEKAKEITRQLVMGLVFLHREQICHRDLKPENVLVASVSPICVKLSDFGISKSTQHTFLRTKIGTHGYIAPELLGVLPPRLHSGNIYTNAVDMWSLGCLIYKILTLQIPFLQRLSTTTKLSGISTNGDYEPSTDMDLLFRFCAGNAELPIDLLVESGVSEGGIQFVKKLLVANPKLRVSAMDTMGSRWMLDLPVDQHEIIRGQFESLGVKLSHLATTKLLQQWEESHTADISIFLPNRAEDIRNLLHAAVSKGYTKIVDIMIYLMPTNKEGIDFRIEGWTPLQLAARMGHLEVVKLLLEKNAKVNASPSKDLSQTALQAAAQGGHLEIVKLLIDNGADISTKARYNTGWDTLQSAAQGGSLEVVSLLLEVGAEVNAPPCMIRGRTALQAAAEEGHLELAQLLVEKGADVNANHCQVKGRTALQAAAENGHLEVVRFLLEEGADVNAEPCERGGQTALSTAIKGDHWEIKKVLCAAGAREEL